MTVYNGDPREYQTKNVPYHFVVEVDGLDWVSKPESLIMDMMASAVSEDMENEILNEIYDENVKRKKNPIKKIFEKVKKKLRLEPGFIFAPYIPLIITPTIFFQENNLLLTPNKDSIKTYH